MKWLMLKIASAAVNAARASSRARSIEHESAGEETADGDHAEQTTLGKYVKQGAVSFERSWKRLPVGNIRSLEMRARPEPERSCFQPAAQRIAPELQPQIRGSLRCFAAMILCQTDGQTFNVVGGRYGIWR